MQFCFLGQFFITRAVMTDVNLYTTSCPSLDIRPNH